MDPANALLWKSSLVCASGRCHQAGPDAVAHDVGLNYSFNIEVKCRSYAEQWASGEGSKAHGDLVAALNQPLAVKLQEAMKQLAELEPTADARPRLLALVGDAKQLLQVMETTKTFGVFRPIHAEWRREAEAKQRAATNK